MELTRINFVNRKQERRRKIYDEVKGIMRAKGENGKEKNKINKIKLKIYEGIFLVYRR